MTAPKAAHTPGPWQVSDRTSAVVDGPHAMVWDTASAPIELGVAAAFGDDDAQIQANARLIAAAPDMYRALQEIAVLDLDCEYPELHELLARIDGTEAPK